MNIENLDFLKHSNSCILIKRLFLEKNSMKNSIFYLILLLPFFSISQTYKVTTTTQGANYSPYTGQGQTTSTSTIKVVQDPNEALVKSSEQFANNIKIAAQNGAFKTASQKCEDVIPISTSLNKYKYIFINKISASKQKEEAEITKMVNEELSNTNWMILDSNKEIPSDLLNNKNIAAYLFIDSVNDGWPFKNVSLTLTDYKGNILHKRAVRHDRSAEFLAKLTLNTIKNYPHNFDLSIVEKELFNSEELGKLSKSDAIKKLKEAKEFLDLNVISKDQYDELVLKLKPILLEN